jgi:ABC-type multidrug transport system fused ATPase/permease subunit
MDSSPSPLDPRGFEDPSLLAWQRLVLPFMMGSLVFVGLVFIAATLWFFRALQERLEYKTTNLVEVIERLPKLEDPKKEGQTYRDWYIRAVLESTALQQRFNVQATVVNGRVWTRFMGFLTGMLLALTGCVFVLGKLRESITFTGEGQGAKAALATSSPGVFLAFLGAAVISISLLVQSSVEMTDVAVYLPSHTMATVAERPDPLPLPQPADQVEPAKEAPKRPPPATVTQHASKASQRKK